MTEKKLKIAIFHNLPSGGAKRSLYNYVKPLSDDGHYIDVYVPETANIDFLPLEPFVNEVNVFKINMGFFRKKLCSLFESEPGLSRLLYINPVISTEKKIAEIINNRNYDIVYCEQDQYTMTPAILKFLNVKTVYYCQQPMRKERIIQRINKNKRKEGIYTNKFLKPFFDRCVNYIVKKDYERDIKFAEYSKNILTNSYYSHENILRQYGKNSHVSYLGIDTNKFKCLDLERERFLLSVGVCRIEKGYDFLIEAIAKIPQDIRPSLIITGNETDEYWVEYLKDLATEKKVSLKILSKISDQKLLELYNKAQMVLVTPYLEPFGYIPLEAMACGTPVIGVKEGGIRESIIHEHTGLLVDRDETDFAKAIIKLSKDKDLWKKYSSNGISYIQNFWTLEKAKKRLLNHFYNIL